MNRFAGRDPKPRSRVEVLVLQQARSPRRAALSDINGIADRGIARYIPHSEFQVPMYNTDWQQWYFIHMRQFLLLFAVWC
jgi:hypothetical protein